MLVAGVAAAFVAAAINLGRMAPATETAAPETGSFRMFTQNEAGRYEAGFNLDTQAGKPTASVYCFPQHPMIHVGGKQVQLDVTSNQTSLVVRALMGGCNCSRRRPNWAWRSRRPAPPFAAIWTPARRLIGWRVISLYKF